MLERINLVPKKETQTNILPAVYGLQLLIFVIIGISFIFQYGQRNDEIASLEKSIAIAVKKQDSTELLQAWIKKLQIETEQKSTEFAKINENLTKLQTVNNEKKFYSKLLDNIEKHLPDSIVCKAILIEESSGTISGEAIEYDYLPEYVENLKKSGMFRTIGLQAIKHDEQSKTFAPYRFNISFQLVSKEEKISRGKKHG